MWSEPWSVMQQGWSVCLVKNNKNIKKKKIQENKTQPLSQNKGGAAKMKDEVFFFQFYFFFGGGAHSCHLEIQP